MKNYRFISVLVFLVAMASHAAPVQGRAPITPAQIAGAISAAGIQISADQVTLLTDVVAVGVFPALTVESMEPWGDHRMKVRISCTVREQCLPFFVAVRLNRQAGSQSTDVTVDLSPVQGLPARLDSKSIVVRAGSAARLLIDSGHVHIRIAVVCLENGAPGQTIRVASKDHRQTYVGKVVDGGVLRAGL